MTEPQSQSQYLRNAAKRADDVVELRRVLLQFLEAWPNDTLLSYKDRAVNERVYAVLCAIDGVMDVAMDDLGMIVVRNRTDVESTMKGWKWNRTVARTLIMHYERHRGGGEWSMKDFSSYINAILPRGAPSYDSVKQMVSALEKIGEIRIHQVEGTKRRRYSSTQKLNATLRKELEGAQP